MSNTIIRIITILVGIVFVVLLAGGVYLFFVERNNTTTLDGNSDSFLRRTFTPLFGPSDTVVTTSTSTSTTSTLTESTSDEIPELFQVWEEPVAGARLVTSTSGDVVRVIDQATGHIFDISLVDGSNTRVTNTTLPNIHSSYWLSDTDVIVQYIDRENEDTVQTFVASIVYPEVSTSTLSTEESVAMLEGTFLPVNITAITVSNGQYAYIVDGELVYNNTTLFRSPLSGWQIDWINDSTISVTQNASNNIDGVSYAVTINGNVSLLVEPTPTLSLIADANLILIGNGTDLFLRSFETEDDTFIDLKTLPEKCIWGARGTLYCGIPTRQSLVGTIPDDWYQGTIQFDDTLFDVQSNQSLFTVPEQFDIIPLATTPTESRILFYDKITDTPWVYTQ